LDEVVSVTSVHASTNSLTFRNYYCVWI